MKILKNLKDYRKNLSRFIEQHGGRVVDAVGDNLLAKFGSAVAAVHCAVEVQKELKAKNQELPEDKRLEFRIGINIGDVIQDGDRIFGDGVNVAARIEGIADPGGVYISRNAYDHVKDTHKSHPLSPWGTMEGGQWVLFAGTGLSREFDLTIYEIRNINIYGFKSVFHFSTGRGYFSENLPSPFFFA